MTVARVLHGPNPAGEVVMPIMVQDGERFELGQLPH